MTVSQKGDSIDSAALYRHLKSRVDERTAAPPPQSLTPLAPWELEPVAEFPWRPTITNYPLRTLARFCKKLLRERRADVWITTIKIMIKRLILPLRRPSQIAGVLQEPPSIALPKPLLSICVTTYNRSAWLAHSLPLILKETDPYQDVVEVVVCDNASTDATRDVVERLGDHSNFRYHRNEKNVGMLGNLSVSCNHSRGRYIWIIGDDDLIVEGTLERVLAAIVLHPELELVYLNYAFTRFDCPADLSDPQRVISTAQPISTDFRDHFAPISAICAKTENCFTGIYCLVFRDYHARRAYNQEISGEPFASLVTSVPTADYICRHMLDRPGYWIGDPCVVVNFNVSWLRYASLFILERFPELYDLMQQNGAPAIEVDRLRADHVRHLRHWVNEIYLGAHRENLHHFSIARLVRRFRHIPRFREQWPAILNVYRMAFKDGNVENPSLTPEKLDALFRENEESLALPDNRMRMTVQ